MAHQTEIEPAGGLRVWVRAMRVHQWIKNVLVLVPLLTSFTFLDLQKLVSAIMAFIAFSFLASGTYLLNDVLDLEHDRQHPRKRMRPLANGEITVTRALLVAAAMGLLGATIALQVSVDLLLVLAAYLVVTLLYSAQLKSVVLIDVLALAGLYALRLLAGAIAIDEGVSPWLLTFSVFVFLSLALVKRCSELINAAAGESAAGRDYGRADLAVLVPLGIGAGLCSVIVLALFISTLDTQVRYASPQLLWFVGVGLLYWIGRVWIKTGRGEMHDDPIVFALRDRGSIVTLGSVVAVTLLAYFGVPTLRP
jgi:4-hydroxybenzoate polyprenyltransferase